MFTIIGSILVLIATAAISTFICVLITETLASRDRS